MIFIFEIKYWKIIIFSFIYYPIKILIFNIEYNYQLNITFNFKSTEHILFKNDKLTKDII